MSATLPGFTAHDAPSYEAINQCIRCGMCLPSCPTYAVLGIEQDSPRGRIALIRAVAEQRLAVTDPDFQTHMYQCLDCRACETACPAGVRFGYLMETARGQIEQARVSGRAAPAAREPRDDVEDRVRHTRRPLTEQVIRWLVFSVLFPHQSRLDLAGSLLRLYQRSGLQQLVRRTGLLRALRLDKQEALLPPLSRRPYHADGRVLAPRATSTLATAAPRRVALFAGCVQRQFFADVNRATERVLVRNGVTVTAPTAQTCCGALHAHAGERDAARDLARRNLDAFDPDSVDAIIINAAGCGAMLKEYGELLHDDPEYAARAVAFSARVRDIHQYLADLPLDPPRSAPRTVRVTYQDACHLGHAQRIRSAPRQILQSIPGLQLVEMAQADWCCGSAGVYNITQPTLSTAILDGKMTHVAATQADVVAAGNPGCILQLRAGIRDRGLKMQVVHPIELLDQAYRAEPTR